MLLLCVILNEWLSLFLKCGFEYPQKWCTYSSVWLTGEWVGRLTQGGQEGGLMGGLAD